MKFPFSTTQNNDTSAAKPLLCNNTSRRNVFPSTNSALASCYEPTSVLDLGRSPSPAGDVAKVVTGIPVSSDGLPVSNDGPSLQWDDHLLHDLDSLDYSLLSELGLNDDSAPDTKSNPQFGIPIEVSPTEFVNFDNDFSHAFLNQNVNHNFNYLDFSNEFHHNHNFGVEFLNELIQAAECFKTNDLQLTQVILARLSQRLRAPTGKPLQRASFYFKEALQSLLAGRERTVVLSSSEIVEKIRAYKAFSGSSPIAMFSSFTANQAILEALDGSTFIHVIDFDVGLGGQWSSFMREIAGRSESCKSNTTVLRITAIVPEEFEMDTRLITDNLSQFARELKIQFHVDFVTVRTFEMLWLKAIKFVDGEKIAVHLSPSIILSLGEGNCISVFLRDLRRITSYVVVFVDGEGWTNDTTASFSKRIVDGLEFYSALMESLDEANAGGGEWIRKIELSLLRPKIFATVEAARRSFRPWRELFSGAGLRPVPLSQFADFQAECLLRTAQIKGFHVAKRHAELLLCWHQRPLVATSAWRC